MVKSVCPKCNQKGEQHVYRDHKNSPRLYLEYIHKTKSGLKRCHIGRVRSTDEVMGEFEKKLTSDELYKMVNNIAKDIRNMIAHYSPKSSLPMKVISKKLDDILKKYNI